MTNKDQKTLATQIGAMASAGLVVTTDPDDAEIMGAFVEDALSAEDASESRFDEIAEGDE
ncbi:hypothetical protein [Magnetospirillum sp. 15-1]|uniref:hypothetical protein n=1 Tax=Magnetospirillum sp. 15-1 TaxID=1979370 RepID=UPI000BBCE291|nr:hypothetical protein [Magnetospirillum sp. 15-1]